MESKMHGRSDRDGYEPPTVVRVEVDPVQDLMVVCTTKATVACGSLATRKS